MTIPQAALAGNLVITSTKGPPNLILGRHGIPGDHKQYSSTRAFKSRPLCPSPGPPLSRPDSHTTDKGIDLFTLLDCIKSRKGVL